MIDAGSEPPLLWPLPEGQQRGVSLEPLHKNAPAAALRDPFLYEMLALIDALREGRARERKLAEQELDRPSTAVRAMNDPSPFFESASLRWLRRTLPDRRLVRTP